ncbi:unnamed protein product [Penicillium salamii]|uniref:Short chain dehydrogenase/reductase n=1 Tax=Penicillium salamii TaxID=1612424 RepID=A0A9W4JUG0_9EURO|nr:unnamed protein product [Penicillium salamii]CAG8101171.1 unnamed protein product [Penicillium salamii]CAG8190190.1 unnamed protein product [Penicillium salamii]CAG8227352.1 unnamed protein product [Penicillium salamii]CAG8262547.1 unnamed protein product [Penicillium salamii]
MASNIHPVFRQGATALITGAASGIGLLTAQLCYSRGMNLVLLDKNETALAQTTKQFPTTNSSKTTTHVMDVSSISAWQNLAQQVKGLYPQGIDFLMLNAGAGPTPAEGLTQWEDAHYFERTFAINTLGYTNGLASFLGTVTGAKDIPRAIVLTGSKQGITNPPSNPAYNASKAAVRTIAEHLAFDLAETAPNVSVHLLIPGWTYTGFHTETFKEKPDGAWTSEQVVGFMDRKMAEDVFYIVCPDNEVTEDLDKRRIRWASDDIIYGRPPLTRWRDGWKDIAQREIAELQL